MSDLGAPFPTESESAPPDDAAEPLPDSQPAAEPSGPDAFAEAVERLREAQDYFAYLLAVEFDRVRLYIRRAASWAILGLAGVAVLVAILMTAAGLLVWGISDLIARALGQPMWVGAVITGGSVLLFGATGLALVLWSWNWSAFSSLRSRYAKRRRRQRERFGRTIDPREDS